MIAEVLRSIEGIATYPVVSMMVFVPFFLGVCVMVVRMRKEHSDRMSKLPLED
jgi:cytochrome c oxidase cbb3-type subunit 4